MAESDISISEMTNGTFTSGALFPAISPNQGGTGYYNVKMSGADIGDGIGQLQFPLRLETENKSIFGAINEAAKSIINFLPIDTASGALASFPDGANGVPLQAIALNVTPAQSGSGDPSPSNVRPITGHDTAVITRTGSNLLNIPAKAPTTQAGVTLSIDDNGIITTNGTGTGSAYFECLRLTKFHKGTFYFNVLVNGERYQVTTTSNYRFYIAVTTAGGTTAGYNANTSFTITEEVTNFIVYVQTKSGFTYNNDVIQFSVTAGATPADLQPYTAATRTAEFGQTIYGATIDPLTGEGTITHEFFTPTTSNVWKNDPNNENDYLYISSTTGVAKNNGSIISNFAPYTPTAPLGTNIGVGVANNGRLWLNLGTAIETNTIQGFVDYCTNNNVQFLYELATPVPITITPTENINTLYGANNIFQDAGDISVTYKADIGLYIAKKTA